MSRSIKKGPFVAPELFKRVARLEKEMGHKPMASDKTDRSLVAMWNRWMSMMHHR